MIPVPLSFCRNEIARDAIEFHDVLMDAIGPRETVAPVTQSKRDQGTLENEVGKQMN